MQPRLGNYESGTSEGDFDDAPEMDGESVVGNYDGGRSEPSL